MVSSSRGERFGDTDARTTTCQLVEILGLSESEPRRQPTGTWPTWCLTTQRIDFDDRAFLVPTTVARTPHCTRRRDSAIMHSSDTEIGVGQVDNANDLLSGCDYQAVISRNSLSIPGVPGRGPHPSHIRRHRPCITTRQCAGKYPTSCLDSSSKSLAI